MCEGISPADARGTAITLLRSGCRLLQRPVGVVVLRYDDDLVPCRWRHHDLRPDPAQQSSSCSSLAALDIKRRYRQGS